MVLLGKLNFVLLHSKRNPDNNCFALFLIYQCTVYLFSYRNTVHHLLSKSILQPKPESVIETQ